MSRQFANEMKKCPWPVELIKIIQPQKLKIKQLRAVGLFISPIKFTEIKNSDI